MSIIIDGDYCFWTAAAEMADKEETEACAAFLKSKAGCWPLLCHRVVSGQDKTVFGRISVSKELHEA